MIDHKKVLEIQERFSKFAVECKNPEEARKVDQLMADMGYLIESVVLQQRMANATESVEWILEAAKRFMGLNHSQRAIVLDLIREFKGNE